jgi:hypothetical protein
MRKLLFILLLTSSFGIKAQNYKGVVQGDTTYYVGASEAYYGYYPQPASILRAIWIETSSQIGTDSIFTFFSSPRIDNIVVSQFCIDTLTGSSWMGKKMIRKQNGEEIYQNIYLDTILIQTQASLGNTWIIVTDSSGVEIWGTISQISVAKIDNTPDSVKEITLQAMVSGNPVAHFLNGKKIVLSKNHGFVKAFEWYIFPYNFNFYSGLEYLPTDTSAFTRIDRQITEMDQNYLNFQSMFQPGTYWQFSDSVFQVTFGVPTGHFINLHKYQDSIVSRTFLSADSLVVNFQRIDVLQTESSSTNSVNPGIFIPTTTTTTYSTYSDTIYKLPAKTIRTNFLPEHLSSNITSGGNIRLPMSSYKKMTDSIYLVSKFIETMYTYLDYSFQIACVSKHYTSSGYMSNEQSFIRNVNASNIYTFELDPNSLAIYRILMIDYYFYKDSNQTWGTPLNLKTLSVNDIAKASVSVYPNPNQSGNFYINTNEKIHWEVTDIQGVKIANGNTPSINLSSKNAGIYLLKIEINGQIYYSKLLKQ